MNLKRSWGGWEVGRVGWLHKRETSTRRNRREPEKGTEEMKGKPQMSRDTYFSD